MGVFSKISENLVFDQKNDLNPFNPPNFPENPMLELEDNPDHQHRPAAAVMAAPPAATTLMKTEVNKEDQKNCDKLNLKMPSLKEFISNNVEDDRHHHHLHRKDDQEEEGVTTPTSLGHKIPEVLKCPPAPRKPKSRPITTVAAKRKGVKYQERRILYDLSNEIEALYPPALRADLGNKIKKVRHNNNELNATEMCHSK